MTKWIDCPGDGPVVIRRVESLSASERRHLDALIKRGHIKNEFEKMRRDDYARRRHGDKRKARDDILSKLSDGFNCGLLSQHGDNIKWPIPK